MRYPSHYASGYQKSATSKRVSEARVNMRYSSLTRRVTKKAQLQNASARQESICVIPRSRVGLPKKRNFKTRQRGKSQYGLFLAHASGYQKSATSKLTRRVTKKAQLQNSRVGLPKKRN